MDCLGKMASSPPPSHATSESIAATAHETISNSSSNYGGIDPEVEENLYILPYVSDEGLRSDATDHRKTIGSSQTDHYPLLAGFNGDAPSGTHMFTPVPFQSRQSRT